MVDKSFEVSIAVSVEYPQILDYEKGPRGRPVDRRSARMLRVAFSLSLLLTLFHGIPVATLAISPSRATRILSTEQVLKTSFAILACHLVNTILWLIATRQSGRRHFIALATVIIILAGIGLCVALQIKPELYPCAGYWSTVISVF